MRFSGFCVQDIIVTCDYCILYEQPYSLSNSNQEEMMRQLNLKGTNYTLNGHLSSEPHCRCNKSTQLAAKAKFPAQWHLIHFQHRNLQPQLA
uniref:Uncharacterized protein n=1 Tax=Rhizophora mucronata TaxID=61149 RepID=A0A2P2JLC8_RHIMU